MTNKQSKARRFIERCKYAIQKISKGGINVMMRRGIARKLVLVLMLAGVIGLIGLGWICAQQLGMVPPEQVTFSVVDYRWVNRIVDYTDDLVWEVKDPAGILVVTFKITKPPERLDLFNVDFLVLYKAERQNWERSIGVAIRCIGTSPKSEETWSLPRQYGHEVGEWTDKEREEYVEVGFLVPKNVTRIVVCVARQLREISLMTPLSLTNPSNSGESLKVEEPVAELVKKAKNAVVQVVAETNNGYSRGSGFIVTEQGFVITSHHVVKEAKRIWVVINSADNLPAELVNGPKTDVDACLLRIKGEGRRYQPLPVAMNVEANNHIGQDVVVLGYPDGDPHLTVTRGLLAGFTSRNGVRCLKTTALVRKGNSGGPVLNMRGEVIGVLWQSEEGGFHYAILTDEIQNLVDYARRQSSRVNQTNPTAGQYTAWACRQ